jgi:hypothetical protein
MKTLLCTLLLAACGAASAKADIYEVFQTPAQTAGPGQTLQFLGTIYDNDAPGSPAEYFNGDSLNLAGVPSPLATTDNFYTNVPFSLSPGGNSGLVDLFDVQVSNPAVNGFYPGTYTLLGGQDGGTGSAQNVLSQTNFSVTVTPEPSFYWVLGAGIAGLVIARKLRAKSPHASTEPNQHAA